MMKRSLYVAGVGLVAAVAALTAQSGQAKQDEDLKPTITSGKQVAQMADISGSVFRQVNLAGSEFENVNMSKARLHDINLSDVSISAANLGGAHFKHLGPAPGTNGKQERQKAVTFEEAMLCRSEEHTSELQSRGHLVCRLLLEKKKKDN